MQPSTDHAESCAREVAERYKVPPVATAPRLFSTAGLMGASVDRVSAETMPAGVDGATGTPRGEDSGCSDKAWRLVTATGLPLPRLRFTLAHEIGHLYLKTEDRTVANEERWCNAFAAELLMPRRSIEALLQHRVVTAALVLETAEMWQVSTHAAFVRMQSVSKQPVGMIELRLSERSWLITAMFGFPPSANYRFRVPRSSYPTLERCSRSRGVAWLRLAIEDEYLEVLADLDGGRSRVIAIVDAASLGAVCREIPVGGDSRQDEIQSVFPRHSIV